MAMGMMGFFVVMLHEWFVEPGTPNPNPNPNVSIPCTRRGPSSELPLSVASSGHERDGAAVV